MRVRTINTMIQYTLIKKQADSVAKKLREAGYSESETSGYTRFSRKRGDSVFISHKRSVIRATKDTQGHEIVLNYFGPPNGKGTENEAERNSSWFFNGYTGRKGTDIGWYQTDNVIPAKFEFSIGGFHEGYCSVVLDGKRFIYTPSYSVVPKIPDQIDELRPSESDWKKFWKKVESVGVWKWKSRYKDTGTLDGTQWGLKLKINKKTKNVYGSNEYPDSFNKFLKAVSELVGGLPIR